MSKFKLGDIITLPDGSSVRIDGVSKVRGEWYYQLCGLDESPTRFPTEMVELLADLAEATEEES